MFLEARRFYAQQVVETIEQNKTLFLSDPLVSPEAPEYAVGIIAGLVGLIDQTEESASRVPRDIQAVTELMQNNAHLVRWLSDIVETQAHLEKVKQQNGKGIELITKLAGHNQRLAQWYYNMGIDSDHPDREHIVDFFSVVAIAKSRDLPWGKDIYNRLQGARAQAGLRQLFTRNDYQVVAPDEKDVFWWDVKNGVDLIAISPQGQAIFVESRASYAPDFPTKPVVDVQVYPIRKGHWDIAASLPRKVKQPVQHRPLYAHMHVSVEHGGQLADFDVIDASHDRRILQPLRYPSARQKPKSQKVMYVNGDDYNKIMDIYLKRRVQTPHDSSSPTG